MAQTKVAFITGGNRGIGFETAKQLGKLGILPVIGSRDLKAGKKAVAELKKLGIESACLQFNVNNRAHHKAAYQFFNKKYGCLDILINNAGVSEGHEPIDLSTKKGATAKIFEKKLRDTLESNFFAVTLITQTLLPLLRKSPAGRIVHLSSILGSLTHHANPKSPIYDMKSFAYDASKTILNALTIHLAYELKDTKIKVNSAHPGWVQTEMGGPQAPMNIVDGAKTSVRLATLPDNGPSGGFFHMNDTLPW